MTVTAPVTTLTAIGRTVQLQAHGFDQQGDTVPLSGVAWSSADTGVVSVSAAGLATARRAGAITVTARAGNLSASVVITVSPRLARLDLAAGATHLTALGDTVTVVAQGFDSSGAPVPTSVVWSVAQPGVVLVSPLGRVTATANGSATVRGTAGPVFADIQLSVQQVATSVVITGAPPLLRALGASVDLNASVTDRNGHALPAGSAGWGSTDITILAVSQAGRVTTVDTGVAAVVAIAGGVADTAEIEVVTSRRMPIDPFLASPATGALWVVPVVLIAYIPTADGINVDVSKAPDFWSLGPISLDSVEQRVLDFSRRRKMMIEEGSRFRGYKDPAALPSIGYRVVEHLVVYDISPPGVRTWPGAPGSPRFPDYHRMFTDWGIDQRIQQEGVREIWLAESSFDAGFPSYNPAIHDTLDSRAGFESNMSSPTTGDISNSFRWNDDLPVYGHTYVLYGINWRRSQAEAVHNVGHQLEATLSYVNSLQDGSTNLFWRQFVGQDAMGNFVTGRAGWTHMPPNTTGNYDYLNPTLVSSDIQDWRADGLGARTQVNVDTWGRLNYPWPGGGGFSQQVESQWYVFWMQNHPGRSNQIPHGSAWMTNWWAFFGDWDAAITSGLGLYGNQPAAVAGSGVMAARLRATPLPPTLPVFHPLERLTSP